jgi:hypothetical protein
MRNTRMTDGISSRSTDRSVTFNNPKRLSILSFFDSMPGSLIDPSRNFEYMLRLTIENHEKISDFHSNGKERIRITDRLEGCDDSR